MAAVKRLMMEIEAKGEDLTKDIDWIVKQLQSIQLDIESAVDDYTDCLDEAEKIGWDYSEDFDSEAYNKLKKIEDILILIKEL